MRVHFLIFTFLVVSGCQSPSESAVPGGTSSVASEKNESIPGDSTVEPGGPMKPKVPTVPSVYLGELGMASIDEPVRVEPMPNGSVLLIVFDALNVKHLGVYGYERPTSPHIDALAKQGLVLTNYVSNSSWTRPSFTTIVTGLPKSEHGVELEAGWRLEPQIVTLAERFRRAGYRTAGFTGNPLVRKSWGFDQGYQVYEDSITLGLKAFFRDKVIIDHAIRWLKRTGNRPFFLVLFMTSSHPPYRPPKNERRFLGELPEGKIIEHPFKEYKTPLPKMDHNRIVAAYDDEVAYMDRQVGRLIVYLRESGAFEKTVIAMTADHGEMFGDHNCYLHAYHMWEPAIRVPFILTAPNLDVKGRVDSRPFTHVDVAPTLLEMVGVDYPKEALRGISLVRALADPANYKERVIFTQYNAHGVRRQAIRKDPFKLIHHHKVHKRAARKLDQPHPTVKQPHPRDLPSLAWDGERYEFYHLANDPGELRDLYSRRKQSDELLELVDALRPHLSDSKGNNGLTPEMVKALKNAGYIRD